MMNESETEPGIVRHRRRIDEDAPTIRKRIVQARTYLIEQVPVLMRKRRQIRFAQANYSPLYTDFGAVAKQGRGMIADAAELITWILETAGIHVDGCVSPHEA